ncbi:MAG: hypothetical protein VKJ64_13505 [Leptolyngbyaceae bacterium]|nr:hypothetical protein [Leptolyngbyaceae bacterium]
MVEVSEMNPANSTVQITLELPQAVYERVMQRAGDRPVEMLLVDLIDQGLQADDAEQLWQQIAEGYNQRLAQAGKLHQTTDEVLAELAVIREQVADEFYPD